MCDLFGGGNKGQDAANQQLQMIQQQQANHDAAVNSDIGIVDKAFSGFNDDYYNNYGKTYRDAMNPQLDYQYGRANSQLNSNLAATDRDMGSTGAYAKGQLQQGYNTAQAGIGNSAVDAENALKANVSNAKTGMYNLAEQATNPLDMATQAQASSGAIVAPQSYPSLANVFGDILSPTAAGLKTSSQGSGGGSSFGSMFQNYFAPTSGGGSGTIT